jgi:hypothetical protein
MSTKKRAMNEMQQHGTRPNTTSTDHRYEEEKEFNAALD